MAAVSGRALEPGTPVVLHGVVSSCFAGGSMVFVLVPDGGTLRDHTPVAVRAGAVHPAAGSYLMAADLAARFKVAPNTFHSWRSRYGPGREPGSYPEVPDCPEPDLHVGQARPQAAWLESRWEEWRVWRHHLRGPAPVDGD